METVDLDMNDIFDRDEDDDDHDYGAHPGLPDLDVDDPVVQLDENPAEAQNEEDEVLENLKKFSKGAAKKKVQKPQPKLDPTRLKSGRGLPALAKLFKETKFKGKGREVDDLKLVMAKLEHWAHRLFPKMAFDDFIERLEKLGAKKELQTCVKRIRLDLPILDGDLEEPQNDVRLSDGERSVHDMSDDEAVMSAERAYDEMILREQEAAAVPTRPTDSQPQSVTGSQPTAAAPIPVVSTPSINAVLPALSQSIPSSPKSAELVTSEQQKRMEQNRMLALQKRAQRLGNSGSTGVLPASTGGNSMLSQPSNSLADIADCRSSVEPSAIGSSSVSIAAESSCSNTVPDDDILPRSVISLSEKTIESVQSGAAEFEPASVSNDVEEEEMQTEAEILNSL